MKGAELREQFKQELRKLALPIMSTKNKLQRRLKKEFRNDGIDVCFECGSTYDFLFLKLCV